MIKQLTDYDKVILKRHEQGLTRKGLETWTLRRICAKFNWFDEPLPKTKDYIMEHYKRMLDKHDRRFPKSDIDMINQEGINNA